MMPEQASPSHAQATPPAPTWRIQVTPAYDLLQACALVARQRTASRWRAWAAEARARSGEDRQRVLSVWFNMQLPAGSATMALVPALPDPVDVPAFLTALAGLPTADFVRLVVTAGTTFAGMPLDATDLLSLGGDTRAAKGYVDRYLHLTGKARSLAVRALANPESARRELLDLLAWYADGPFAAMAPALRDEREAAGEWLRATGDTHPGKMPPWLNWTGDLGGFHPRVLAPSALLESHASAYYHEVERTLFDGADYEPFISVVGTDRVLGQAAQRGRTPTATPHGEDPAARLARMLAALADPARLRIVRLLAQRPYYGQELASALGTSGATISHHIQVLSAAGLIRLQRQAHRSYFVLAPDALSGLFTGTERYISGGELADAPPQESEPDV